MATSCLGDPMDRGAWQTTVHGVEKVRQDSVTKQQQQQSHIVKAALVAVVYVVPVGRFAESQEACWIGGQDPGVLCQLPRQLTALHHRLFS